MGILKKKNQIIIEKNKQDIYTIKTEGVMNISEVCDALVGALCIAAKKLISNGLITPSLFKSMVIFELDERLGGENENKQ